MKAKVPIESGRHGQGACRLSENIHENGKPWGDALYVILITAAVCAF